MGTLLEQSSPWQEQEAISLSPGLLGSSWGSEAPAWVLLEECGLELQVAAPQVCWEPEAQGPTCALYACLALLLQLSQLRWPADPRVGASVPTELPAGLGSRGAQ